MKKYTLAFLFTALVMILFPLFALALDAVPEMDPLQAGLALFASFKTAGPLGIGMASIVFIMGILKKVFGDFKLKRLVVTVLACAYGVLLSVTNGLSVWSALLAVLVTGGGAIAIYEGLKGAGIIKKAKA